MACFWKNHLLHIESCAEATGKGYSLGGILSSTHHTIIDGVIYDTNSSFLSASTLPAGMAWFAGVNANTEQKGYAFGGEGTGWSATNEIQGVNFADDTSVNPSATLPFPFKFS